MWNGKTIAAVLPTYRERATIRGVVEELKILEIVDDVIVVNNNAEPGTSEELIGTGAREILEPLQGYGASIRRGLREADADLVMIIEPDGTFDPNDIWKLLAYSTDFDFVYGSRTIPEFIWDGANMGRFLRWGNWFVAKLMEMSFNTTSLSDVGCTMRLASGPALRQLEPHFTVTDGAFGPEMMLLSIIGGWRIVQLPVNYRARGGAAGTTESFTNALTIGLQMLRLIGSYRLRSSAVARKLGGPGLRTRLSDDPAAPRPGGEPIHMFPRLRRPRR
jgi:glycosyltransferase involved in cell wall biosynthesis